MKYLSEKSNCENLSWKHYQHKQCYILWRRNLLPNFSHPILHGPRFLCRLIISYFAKNIALLQITSIDLVRLEGEEDNQTEISTVKNERCNPNQTSWVRKPFQLMSPKKFYKTYETFSCDSLVDNHVSIDEMQHEEKLRHRIGSRVQARDYLKFSRSMTKKRWGKESKRRTKAVAYLKIAKLKLWITISWTIEYFPSEN